MDEVADGAPLTQDAEVDARPPVRLALVAGVLAFLLYTLTSPAGISWEHSGEDGPEFAAVAKVLGVAHP
ncbi:MAG TPA: hypothetical protein VF720_08975, partial [Candidatus Eisenbacteria bacterium]